MKDEFDVQSDGPGHRAEVLRVFRGPGCCCQAKWIAMLPGTRGATRAEIPYALAEINWKSVGNQLEISWKSVERKSVITLRSELRTRSTLATPRLETGLETRLASKPASETGRHPKPVQNSFQKPRGPYNNILGSVYTLRTLSSTEPRTERVSACISACIFLLELEALEVYSCLIRSHSDTEQWVSYSRSSWSCVDRYFAVHLRSPPP